MRAPLKIPISKSLFLAISCNRLKKWDCKLIKHSLSAFLKNLQSRRFSRKGFFHFREREKKISRSRASRDFFGAINVINRLIQPACTWSSSTWLIRGVCHNVTWTTWLVSTTSASPPNINNKLLINIISITTTLRWFLRLFGVIIRSFCLFSWHINPFLKFNTR